MVMRKAVIVGGGDGIGLAIAKEYIQRGYFVEIVGKNEPDESINQHLGLFRFHKNNLLDLDEQLFKEFASDETVDTLIITAGFGRVANFEYLHPIEIDALLTVNSSGTIKIIYYFFERIKSDKAFYCGVMGSIAGLVSSPLFAVYGASKAAVCSFIESINIELAAEGINNRILNVSPGSIPGTRFHGNKHNIPELTAKLASEIVERILERETLYIPDFDHIYKDVIDRYREDPLAFGLSSYEYKKKSGRICNERKIIIGYLSGTFDLFHIGHLKLIRRAKQQCDYLIVGVHPNAAHKGKETFVPYEERLAIVESLKYVDKAVMSAPEDSTAWDMYHYDRLFVGSDYKGSERFIRYEEYFKNKGVEIIYFPYTKGTNSTQLREALTVLSGKK